MVANGCSFALAASGTARLCINGMAKALARPGNDAALAMVQEVAGLHHKLIAGTLPKLRRGELFTLADQDGELIARSSRILEAFQAEAIQRTFPAHGAVRLLEIGCGSAVYLRYAANRNPSLTALGVELQSDVAEVARTNLRTWNLESRVKVEHGDIRSKTPGELFDIATLYNNIYYFPVEERVALLKHLASFLKPGGFLLLTTCCQGGSLGTEALNLWGAATARWTTPAQDELVSQLRHAGYSTVKTINLLSRRPLPRIPGISAPGISPKLSAAHLAFEAGDRPSSHIRFPIARASATRPIKKPVTLPTNSPKG